jgi:protein involved in polysaccharide export with SLBB domain
MRIKDLIFKAGDLTQDAYLPRAELIRTDKDRRKRTIYLDLAEAMNGNPQHNINVQNEDSLVIHSIWEEQWKKFVGIKGEIKKPGRYALTKEMRLSDLIFKSGNFTQNAYENLGHLYRTDWRTKEITIHTFNVAMAMKGDTGNNLLLKDLDQVVIHNIRQYKPEYTVSIKGMVHQPGEYPLAANMTIRDLIVVGGNIRDGAYLEKGELVRYQIVDGQEVVSSLINFDVSLALRKDPANNLPLQPMDVVQVKKIPGWWEKKKTVTLAGEVTFPGTYQILSQERLSDILKRAGGFTKEAYQRGAFFTRASVREKQKAELNGLLKRLEIDMAGLAALENETFLSEAALSTRAYLMAAQNSLLTKLKEKKPSGRVIISLLPAEKLAGDPNDLLLEAGDRLFIPKNPNTVHVLGAVYHPVTAVYDSERGSVSYYLDKAGGPTENAQTDQIYIVRTDGSVVSKSGRPDSFEKTLLYPGDSIIAPHQGIRPAYFYTLAETAQAPR